MVFLGPAVDALVSTGLADLGYTYVNLGKAHGVVCHIKMHKARKSSTRYTQEQGKGRSQQEKASTAAAPGGALQRDAGKDTVQRRPPHVLLAQWRVRLEASCEACKPVASAVLQATEEVAAIPYASPEAGSSPSSAFSGAANIIVLLMLCCGRCCHSIACP